MKLKPVFLGALLFASPALASAFWPGTVINVPVGQSLQIRTEPSVYAPVLGNVANGTSLSLTGRCQLMKVSTYSQRNFRIDGSGTVEQKIARMRAPRTWCEVFYEISATNHQRGWARGSFISPQ
jgi:hypothetical protein